MLELKEIKLPLEKDDKRLKRKKGYLAKIGLGCPGGEHVSWYLGTFTRYKGHELEFNSTGSIGGIHYNAEGWKELYEIIGIEKISTLIPRDIEKANLDDLMTH